MATAMAKGFVSSGISQPNDIILSGVNEQRLLRFKDLGYHLTFRNEEVVRFANIIILAVKPQIALNILQEDAAPYWNEDKLLISICAGLTIQDFENVLHRKGTRIARVMPNTCCLVGESASGYTLNHSANAANDKIIVEQLLNAIGRSFFIPEYQMNALTGVSGSGPAYVYMFIEAMADAGVKEGLPRDIALNLAAQTVLGSAKMVLETQIHPAILKDQVTSPAGTTIAAVEQLETRGFRAAIFSAVSAAKNRAEEISRNK